jgi:hypothetical protein
MQDQWLPAALADPLADAGPANQIGCDGSVLAFGDIPGDSVTARKDDAPAAVQAANVNVAGLDSISGGGGLIQTTSG